MLKRLVVLAVGMVLFGAITGYAEITPEQEMDSKVQSLLVSPQPEESQKIWGTLEGPFLVITRDNDNAIRELAGFGNEAVIPLIKALSGKNSLLVKRRAIVALGEIRDAKATPILVDALLDESLPENFGVLESLAQINDPQATELFIAALPKRNVRDRVLKALGFLKDLKAAGPLFEILLTDESYGWMAAEALGKIKDPAITEKLIELIKNREVRANAIFALGETGNTIAVDALLEIISRDKDARLRAKAATALGRLKDSKAEEALLLFFAADPEANVRAATAYALGEINDPRAIAPLIESLQKEKDEAVRSQSAEALSKITQKNFGTDYAKWAEWQLKNKR